MSDFKSKLPDFKEICSMTSKLFSGIKKSIDEIVEDYKEKRSHEEPPASVKPDNANTKETIAPTPPPVPKTKRSEPETPPNNTEK